MILNCSLLMGISSRDGYTSAADGFEAHRHNPAFEWFDRFRREEISAHVLLLVADFHVVVVWGWDWWTGLAMDLEPKLQF